MKQLACKTFSREIDELERGQEPKEATRAHLRGCAACSSFYDDRVKLQQMIAGLEPVQAPGDFDFRLRARLVDEREHRASRFTPAFGFGLPTVALAVIAILVGVGLYSRMTTEPVGQQDSASVETPSAETTAKKPAPEIQTAEEKKDVPQLAIAKNRTDQATLASDRGRNRKANRNAVSNAVRRDDFVAKSEALFPLEAAEPLRVSVDYATGASRTISVPAVSFGSQQVVARGASMMKTSGRTVW